MYLSLHISAQHDEILTHHLSVYLSIYRVRERENFSANLVDECEDFTRDDPFSSGVSRFGVTMIGGAISFSSGLVSFRLLVYKLCNDSLFFH
ncbi:hypothetical protein VNO80_03384 [Phaseolus coccineus]|uniref:Uncharacterized protein n=1 Tax=Phaseolus coccineus TaxID=3886 RepID=A0AAN9NWP3_PHACN